MRNAKAYLLVALTACVTAMPVAADDDPLMGLNRATHKFNDVADKILLKPAARVYKAITPGFVRSRVGDFFSNLDDINTGINNVLQGKPRDGVRDFARVFVNTTLGFGGLFDPATNFGYEKHQEDFGQTLAVWGAGQGPYLVLPFMGPSTLRDTLGRPVNSLANPVRYLHPVDHRNVLYGVDLLDTRVELLKAESVMFGDEYIFIRDAYLQRREYLINDGEVKDSFCDF